MSYSHITKERIHATPKKMLEVPLISSELKVTDSVACTVSLLRYFGYDFDSNSETYYELSQKSLGVYDILNYINTLTFDKKDARRIIRARMFRYSTLCDVMADLDKDIPVIMMIQARNQDELISEKESGYRNEQNCGHFVIAVGYDEKRIYFMDPSTDEAYSYIPICELDERWHIVEDGEWMERCAIEVEFNQAIKKSEFVYKIF